MDTDKHEKIFEVFNAALELPADDRLAFVATKFGDDDQATTEVLELIESHEGASSFLLDSPADLATEALAENSLTNIRKKIGAYKIEKQIGFGGMGTVYLAARDDEQYDQKVAIKILKRGMDTDQIIKRFKYERQILAELNHPNIAKLLDGGTTAKGLPYFVLEYIDGLPITKYCETHGLDLNKRLRLFREVCGAVSYAHQNLVIHRDIKPGNILVTKEGIPKLLDFGIAKVLQSDSDLTELTMTGERLMTPKYASPEQARGGQITTASDVYGLGVLFYELLTGKLPYDLKTKTSQEIEQIICDQEPSLPSSEFKVKTSKTNHEPKTLSPKLLKGDLDNIALMALEKEPDKRYSSVDEFSKDIERYLEGMPIDATAHTFAYRTAKFVKRHAIGVTLAALISTLVVGFAITSRIQANQIASERDRSEKVVSFMRDIFKGNDPANAKGKEVSARELLDKGIVKIESELANQPDVQASLLDTVGQVYQSLGLYDKSKNLFEKALKNQREYFGNESREVADTLLNLSDVERIKADFKKAEKYVNESITIRHKLYGRESTEVVAAINLLISINVDNKDFVAAEKLSIESIELSEKLYGSESPEAVSGYHNLASVYLSKGETEKAEANARKAVEMSKNVFEKPHAAEIEANIALARLLIFRKQNFTESKKLLDRARDLGETVYGYFHPKTVWILTNYAGFYFEDKQFENAIETSNKILEVQRKLYGNDHPQIASALTEKGSFLFHAGRLDDAEDVWNKALKLRRKTLGTDHPYTTRVLGNLGLVKYEKKEYRAAAEVFRNSLAIQRKTLKPSNPQIGFSLVGLGKSLVAEGKAMRAETLIKEGVNILENSFFKNTWYLAEAKNVLGSCLLAEGKYKEAEPLLTSSYKKIEEKHGARHKKTNQARKYLIKLYEALGQPKKASNLRRIS